MNGAGQSLVRGGRPRSSIRNRASDAPASAQPRLASNRRRVPAQPFGLLHRTWCFRLAMLAFLALSTKSIAQAMHGLLGLFVILALAAVASVFEGSFTRIWVNVRRNAAHNLPLVILALWYLTGVFVKMYLMGGHNTDWRLVMSPVLLILGLLMCFAFLHEERCSRLLQVSFIVMVGVQSVFTGSVVVGDSNSVRDQIGETEGAWSYGDQGGFAMQAMLLPILAWRAFVEQGVLRLLLLLGCAAIAFTVAISQFGTAFGLLLLAFPTAIIVAVCFMRRQIRLSQILMLALLALGGALLFSAMLHNPLLEAARSRIINVWKDPRSGGYEEKYAEEGSRWMLAEISVASFRQHPFFGAGAGGIRLSNTVGGHSAFFDMLGFYGLLGGAGAFFLMLLLMLARTLRRQWRQRDWATVAAVTSVVLLLIGGIVNPYWEGETTITVLLLGRLFRLPQEPA